METTKSLLQNSRFWILLASGVLALLIWRSLTLERGELAGPQLAQWYGLVAFGLLYVTLLISPLYRRFPTLPGKPELNHARRALGVSAFGFALLHTLVATGSEIGGLENLTYLSPAFLFSLGLGAVALLILLLLALTSFDGFIAWLGPWWKRLHQFVYLAAIVVLIHTAMIGSHFVDLGRAIPTIVLVATAILIILESYRVEAWVADRVSTTLARIVVPVTTVVILSILTWFILAGGVHTHVAQAHTVHVEQEIGLVLHVDPNDSPIAEQESTVFLELSDSASQFTFDDCACVATVTLGEREIVRELLVAENPIDMSTTFRMTFPERGDYALTVSGVSLIPGEFDPFTVTAPIKVTQAAGTDVESPPQSPHNGHLIAAFVIAAAVGFDVVRQQLRKRKSD